MQTLGRLLYSMQILIGVQQNNDLYRVTVEAIPEKRQLLAKDNSLAKSKAKRWRFIGIVLLLLCCILALILGLVLGLRRSSSNTEAVNSPGVSSSNASIVSIPAGATATSFAPLQPNFISFAIEYAFFPQFAGNTSNPNMFSYNVLSNIKDISGTMPYVRVGGDSADLAIYDAMQANATHVTYRVVNDNKKFGAITIGPPFFESFTTWDDVKFIVGLNLRNATSTEGLASLNASVAASCMLLKDRLLWWEYGNEPDQYHDPAHRPADWDAASYVEDWQFGAKQVRSVLQEQCPDMAGDTEFGFVGPSLFGPSTYRTDRLLPGDIFSKGYNDDGLVKEYALHHYMADCAQVACDQQSMLLNHTYIKSSLANITAQMTNISNNLPSASSHSTAFILDEVSMFLNPDAAPAGTSNTFGAALWALDFSLYCMCIGISRIHMQQGLGFSYNSWSPINLPAFPMDVYPVYYGNIAAASALGNFSLGSAAPTVAELTIQDADDFETAYAIYSGGEIPSRIVVINLNQFNSTDDANSRANRTYTFELPGSTNNSTPLVQTGFSAPVARLTAGGADSESDVTYNGYSYQYNPTQGKAAKVASSNELAVVSDGKIQISVPDSSAVILDLQSGHLP